MRKINQHIEIVSSTVPSLSSMGKVSREAILKKLSKHYSRVGITIVNDLDDLEALVNKSPDLVFLGMKFIHQDSKLESSTGGKIWLAEYLAERGIASTGSRSDAHRLELNKHSAKKCVIDAGLKTSEFYLYRNNQPLNPAQLPSSYPLFVKPTDLGGGAGIDSDSVVESFSQLQNKIAAIYARYNTDSLIEKYLPGREFSVAILKNEDHEGYSVMPIELIAPSDEKGIKILSGKIKAADAETVEEVSDESIRQAVSDLAIDVFHALGARDYGRIDIRLDDQGIPHFLEANLIPSLIDNYGSFPKACTININLDHEDMLLHIVSLGLMRSESAAEAIEPALPSVAALSQA